MLKRERSERFYFLVKIHERVLRIANKDYFSSFDALSERNKSLSIHKKNLQTLMTETFKTQSDMSLRNNNEFVLPRIKTVNLDMSPSDAGGLNFGFPSLKI